MKDNGHRYVFKRDNTVVTLYYKFVYDTIVHRQGRRIKSENTNQTKRRMIVRMAVYLIVVDRFYRRMRRRRQCFFTSFLFKIRKENFLPEKRIKF